MRDQKINVGICPDTDKAAILDFQNWPPQNTIFAVNIQILYVFMAKESNALS